MEIIGVTKYLSLITHVNVYVNFSFHFTQIVYAPRGNCLQLYFQCLLSFSFLFVTHSCCKVKVREE